MRSPTRREFLAAFGTTATISATAGCTGSEGTGSDSAARVAGDRTDWPTVGHDGANTGYNPNGRGPRSSPSVTWKVELNMASGSPVVAEDRVFVPDGERLACYDANDGKRRWEYEPSDDGSIWSAPTVRNGTVYVSGPDATVTAVDADSGKQRRQFETKGNVSAAPRFDSDGELLFAVTDEGWIHCFDLEKDEERWKRQVFGEIQASPAFDPFNLRVFVGTYGGEVYAFSALSGGRLWRRKLPSIITAAPTIIGGSLYVPCFTGQVFCLDTNAGAGGTRWSTEHGGNVATNLAVADGTVFGVRGDEFYAINTDSGQSRWSFGLSGVSMNSPSVVGDTVYIGDGNGAVYALETGGGSGIGDTRFGAKRWKYDFDAAIRGGFAVADGTLFTATNRGDASAMLYALRED